MGEDEETERREECTWMRVCSEMSQGTPPRNILVGYEECGAAVLDL